MPNLHFRIGKLALDMGRIEEAERERARLGRIGIAEIEQHRRRVAALAAARAPERESDP